MHLSKLWVQNLRSFEQLEISFSKGMNVFVGGNGVGKTSILEAIDVLSRGRSFRAAQLSEIITYNKKDVIITAEVIGPGDDVFRLGVAKNLESTELRLNQQNAKKWSDLAKYLPLLAIHPESYLLITGGPSLRRKYLDWGVFHVEQDYPKIWGEYVRALKQRNLCLKLKRLKEARYWHKPLVENGEKIRAMRSQYCSEVAPIVQEYAVKLGLNDAIELIFQPGWDTQFDLIDLLEIELNASENTSSTINGSHRADILVMWNGRKFAKTSSRGQQKVLAIALKLAQSHFLSESHNKSTIYLIDELPAELDHERCRKTIELLEELNAQTLITSVSTESIANHITCDAKWFHVKRGHVSSMV